MNDIADEIGKMTEMLTADDDGEVNEPEPKQDPEPTPDDPKPDKVDDPKPEADPEPDPDVSEPESDSDPKPDEPDKPEPEPKKDPDPDEVTTLKAKIIELEAASKVKAEPKPEPDPEPKPKEDPKPKEPEPIPDQDFLGDIDLDDLTRSPQMFNELLNTVSKKIIEATRTESLSSQEGVLKSIPDIVKNSMAIATTLKKASNDFYNENKELKPFQKVVAAVFEEISSENPDKEYTEIFKGLGDEVRNRLDLQKKAANPDPDPNKDKDKDKDNQSPKLPRNKGNKRQSVQKPKTGSLQSELDEMNKSLEEE